MDTEEISKMQNALSDYNKWFETEEGAELDAFQADIDLKELKDKYNSIEVCPLCGRPMEKGNK